MASINVFKWIKILTILEISFFVGIFLIQYCDSLCDKFKIPNESKLMSKYNDLFDEKINDFDKKLGLFLNDTKPKLIYGKVIGYMLILSLELYGIIKKICGILVFGAINSFIKMFFSMKFFIYLIYFGTPLASTYHEYKDNILM